MTASGLSPAEQRKRRRETISAARSMVYTLVAGFLSLFVLVPMLWVQLRLRRGAVCGGISNGVP